MYLTDADLYLDWVNNFVTLRAFAEHYDFTMAEARSVIEKGRKDHEDRCAQAAQRLASKGE